MLSNTTLQFCLLVKVLKKFSSAWTLEYKYMYRGIFKPEYKYKYEYMKLCT